MWAAEEVGLLGAATELTARWFFVRVQPLAFLITMRLLPDEVPGQLCECSVAKKVGALVAQALVQGEGRRGLPCLHLKQDARLPPSPGNRNIGRRNKSLHTDLCSDWGRSLGKGGGGGSYKIPKKGAWPWGVVWSGMETRLDKG